MVRDADQAAVGIEQPAAAGAPRDGGRGLHALQAAVIVGAQRRDQPFADGQLQPERIADRVHLLARHQRAARRQGHGRIVEIGHAQLAQIALHVRILQARAEIGIAALEPDLLAATQHVAVGDDHAIADHHGAAHRQPLAVRPDHPDLPDAGRHFLENLGGLQRRGLRGSQAADGRNGQTESGSENRPGGALRWKTRTGRGCHHIRSFRSLSVVAPSGERVWSRRRLISASVRAGHVACPLHCR